MCSVWLWPLTLKINRCRPLVSSMFTTFDGFSWNSSVCVVFTRFNNNVFKAYGLDLWSLTLNVLMSWEVCVPNWARFSLYHGYKVWQQCVQRVTLTLRNKKKSRIHVSQHFTCGLFHWCDMTWPQHSHLNEGSQLSEFACFCWPESG